MKPPTILLVNDDGYDAPGIQELYQAVESIGDVHVVAPATQQSGTALGFTFTRPLEISKAEGYKKNAWKVSGTPADCVKVAVSVLGIQPDIILSGINHGTNAGRNAFYSGTVGGVLEGALRGIPGIAFSFEHLSQDSFFDMKMFIPPIVLHTLEHGLPRYTFFNVTFPHHPQSSIKGIRVAKQGMSYVQEDPSTHADGSVMLNGKWNAYEEHPDTDIALLKEGYITMAPITARSWTDHETYDRYNGLFTTQPLEELLTEQNHQGE